MDVFSKRCGCGAIFKLASLRARTTQCEACARKGSRVVPEMSWSPTGRRLKDGTGVTDGVLIPPGSPYFQNTIKGIPWGGLDYGANYASLRKPAPKPDPLHSLGVYELNGRDPRAVAAAGALCTFVSGLGACRNKTRAPRYLRNQLRKIEGEWFKHWPEARKYHDAMRKVSPRSRHEAHQAAHTYRLDPLETLRYAQTLDRVKDMHVTSKSWQGTHAIPAYLLEQGQQLDQRARGLSLGRMPGETDTELRMRIEQAYKSRPRF